jgi:hypothetical protein
MPEVHSRKCNGFKNLAEKDSLKIRLYAMLGVPSKDMSKGELDSYPWIGLGHDFFTVTGDQNLCRWCPGILRSMVISAIVTEKINFMVKTHTCLGDQCSGRSLYGSWPSTLRTCYR